MSIKLDRLDFKLLKYICTGFYSYDELAKLCGIGRNTVYRRIRKLERMEVISRRLTAIPNFEKLNVAAVIGGLNLDIQDMSKVVEFLKQLPQIMLICRSYGEHDVVFILLCKREEVGKCIYELRDAFEKRGIRLSRFDLSVSVSWDKLQFTIPESLYRE